MELRTTEGQPVGLYETELAEIKDLKAHPRNYRGHPDDQVAHLVESLKEHGVYRNVVAAQDGTILAGHGVVKAAQKMGLTKFPIIRLKVSPDDPRALKILIGDNEIEHLAEQNDRLLSELLKQVKETDSAGLMGTGYDDMMLANFLMVTRPASEIADFDAAAAWVGMPGYEPGEVPYNLVITFPGPEKRDEFVAQHGLAIDKKSERSWSTRWPWTGRQDKGSIRFVDAAR